LDANAQHFYKIETATAAGYWCGIPKLFFNMLLVAENAITDRPPIVFCILFLLGSKYAGLALAALQRLPLPLYNIEALVHFGARDFYLSRRML